MCFASVYREQLFVKVEMRSIRGPDGIQLREIKWWWIAAGQWRPVLLYQCVCVYAHMSSLIQEESRRKQPYWFGEDCVGENKEERGWKRKDTKGKFLARASRKKRGREQCARWMRRRRSERRRVYWDCTVREFEERTNCLLASDGKWEKYGRQERWINRWMNG